MKKSETKREKKLDRALTTENGGAGTQTSPPVGCYCKELNKDRLSNLHCHICFDKDFPGHEPKRFYDWPYEDSEHRHRFEISMEKSEDEYWQKINLK